MSGADVQPAAGGRMRRGREPAGKSGRSKGQGTAIGTTISACLSSMSWRSRNCGKSKHGLAEGNGFH